MDFYDGVKNKDYGLRLGVKQVRRIRRNAWSLALLSFLGMTLCNGFLYAGVGLDPGTTSLDSPFNVEGNYSWRNMQCGIGSFTKGPPQHFINTCASPELDQVTFPGSTISIKLEKVEQNGLLQVLRYSGSLVLSHASQVAFNIECIDDPTDADALENLGSSLSFFNGVSQIPFDMTGHVDYSFDSDLGGFILSGSEFVATIAMEPSDNLRCTGGLLKKCFLTYAFELVMKTRGGTI